MRKCGKVKNPCRICFTSVSKKNGLSCNGACKKWAHYKCLDFTPGKIKDIKAGLVKVNCPCPDCNFQPKEEYTNLISQCDTADCPAKKKVQCEVPLCPKNNIQVQTEGTYDCPSDCKPQSKSQQQYVEPCIRNPKKVSKDCTTGCPSELPVKESHYSQNNNIPGTQQICTQSDSPNDSIHEDCEATEKHSPTAFLKSQRPIDRLCPVPTCPFKMRQLQTSKPECRNENHKKNMSPNIRGSKSVCSNMAADYSREYKKASKSVSEINMMSPSETRKVMLDAIAQMCNTVGQFTNQFKELMNKLMTNLDKQN